MNSIEDAERKHREEMAAKCAEKTERDYNECGRKWSNVCLKHHLQMCHECERIDCHDNNRLQFSKDYFSPAAVGVRSEE